ncbi:MAG: hypothetical protein J0I19_11965 [Alphaproteobacteria bacterium]|nr:hypothetical protein [Alphaproteobacteria bacterium]
MMDRTKLYLATIMLLAAAIMGGTGLLNYLVDPLWFFGGDKLAPRNFPWDERTARIAQFVTGTRDYDCYIFGASRVGMLNFKNVAGHKCFLVSFEYASPGELVAYAKYIKQHAAREPDLIMVGIEDANFIDNLTPANLADPVRENRTPHFWQYYFSLDVAKWSLKTISDAAPKARYYGKDLTGKIRADAGTMPILRLKMAPGEKLHMSLKNVPEFANFRALFPKAHLVGFATPVASARIKEYQLWGLLPVYLKALHATAEHFDEMYDFSIPSRITNNPNLTYDGSHYQPAVYDLIIKALQRHEPSFGIKISGCSLAETEAQYQERLKAGQWNEAAAD